MPTWVGTGQKFDFFGQKSWFFCNSKHFRQNIWHHAIHSIFAFFIFSISFKSLWFLSLESLFKDPNVFEFTDFSFQTKPKNTVVFPVNSNYLFSSRKQKKNRWNPSSVYLLIFRQNSMIFEGSSNSLTESYFTGKLRLGKS